MTCEQIREELELLVGQAELPDEIARHLGGCAECRLYWEELSVAAEHIGEAELFGLSDEESLELTGNIERAITPQEKTTVTSLRWLRYAAAAAVVTLSVGIGYYELRDGVAPDIAIPSDSARGAFTEFPPVTPDTIQLSSEEIEQVMREYTYDMTITADEQLLESLSDDDLNYLEENLDVGDLL